MQGLSKDDSHPHPVDASACEELFAEDAAERDKLMAENTLIFQ
jgi:hypothetical protein